MPLGKSLEQKYKYVLYTCILLQENIKVPKGPATKKNRKHVVISVVLPSASPIPIEQVANAIIFFSNQTYTVHALQYKASILNRHNFVLSYLFHSKKCKKSYGYQNPIFYSITHLQSSTKL